MAGSRPQTGGQGRFAGLLLLIALLLLTVGARLVWVQVISSRAYALMAEDQRVKDMELSPRRGSIFDREGEPMAVTVDAKTIFAVPSQVADKRGTSKALARILGGKPATYLKRLSHRGAFVYIARKVDMERAQAVERLQIEGIGMLDDSRRAYPSGELASQMLGFVGVDDEGLAGLEKHYDSALAGTPGRVLAERDPSGRYVLPGGVMRYEDPVDGRSITLTIDKDLQYQAHVELAATVKRFKARGGSVLIMDPRNGEILAAASTPNFNPNDFARAKPGSTRLRPVTDTYEPGSTIKSFTAAAVIEEGLFNPKSRFSLPSTIKVGGRVIHESHGRGAVNYSLSDIVTKSSNVGAVKLGLALGRKRIYRYFSRFGLTSRTGVDFPGEASGWMPAPGAWSSSTIGNVPFGQGLTVTPLQIARGLSAVANGGVMPTPHFLLGTSGESTPRVWPTKRVVSVSTARTMTGILGKVVRDGTGESAKVPGYEVAGKTGTAQKAGAGGYEKGRYVASFAGYLPTGDPRVLIVVTVDEPANAIYGGAVAAPAFSNLAKFAVAHLKVPPVTLEQRDSGEGGRAQGDDRVSDRSGGAESAQDPVVESGDPDR